MKTVELYNHNKKTYENIVRLFQTEKRVAVVQPTGSGKSFLIFKLAQDNADKKITMFVPNRNIRTRITSQAKEYGIKNLVIYTYQKLIKMSDDEIAELDAGYICLDELHHIKAQEWNKAVTRLMDILSSAKILGTTATPQRTDGINVLEDFCPELACNMSLGDGIVNGILPTPTYISALYTFDEEVNKVQNAIDKSANSNEEKKELEKMLQEAKHKLELSNGVPTILNKHIPSGKGKYIVFCQNIKHLRTIKPSVLEWFEQAGFETVAYEIHSKNAEKDMEFNAFCKDNSDRIALLFCVDMLSEGVHVKDVTGVILLRPTKSHIVYFQQIGRAIDAANNKNPIIFDLVNNSSYVGTNGLKREIEVAMERKSDFDAYRNEIHKFNIEDFHIYDYVADCLNVFKSIHNKCLDYWDKYYSMYLQFVKVNHHGHVTSKNSTNFEGLSEWCQHQRSHYIMQQLSNDKIKMLNNNLFIWDVPEYLWQYKYNLLVEAKSKGIAITNKTKYKGENLGNFLCSQKRSFANGTLDSTKFALLQKAGIFETTLDYMWNHKYNLCLEAEKEGIVISRRTVYKNVKIGDWVNNQKRKNNLSKDKQEKMRKLRAYNYSRDIDYETRWENFINIMEGFISENINLNRNTIYDGFPLGARLREYKKSYNCGKFPQERYEQLKTLGIDLAKKGSLM